MALRVSHRNSPTRFFLLKIKLMLGHIRVSRIIQELPFYTDSNTFRLFFHCLINANYKAKKWNKTEIQRGQFIGSQSGLKDDLGLSLQQIRTALKKLADFGEITILSTDRFSTYTVVNYEVYVSSANMEQHSNNIVSTEYQQSDNTVITTTKEERKKEKKREEAHTSEILPPSFSQNKIKELEAQIKILETPSEIAHQNHKPIPTPAQNLALTAFEQLAERKNNSNWTSLDMTLNGGYKLPSSWSELLQNEVVGYWIYMEGKKGNAWGAARTISGQVDIINAFLKTNSEQEIIDSIQDCVNRGDSSFNPEWTKNRKKAQPSTATPTYELPKFANQDESDRYFMGKFTKYRPHLDNRLCNTVYRERMQKKELPALIYELEQEHPHLLKL